MLSVFRFAIALKKTDFDFLFRFLFSVYGIETGNLYFGGSIKETKMAALEDVLDRDENEKENQNPFFKSYSKTKNGEHKVNSNSVSFPAGKIEK